MIAPLLFAALNVAHAADSTVAYTDIETRSGLMSPGVLVGLNPQPEPPGDWWIERYYAELSQSYTERLSTDVVIAIGEERHDVASIWLVDGRDEVLVYGKGAEERWLPPGPCFELRTVFDDGTELLVSVDIESADGWIDPGSLVGFNPQPEPPGDFQAGVEIALVAEAERSADLSVTVSIAYRGVQQRLY